jgi:hypothetical protein
MITCLENGRHTVEPSFNAIFNSMCTMYNVL